MKACVALVALLACAVSAQDGDLGSVSGLSCPAAGYMFPDPNNLCFVWFCEMGGEAPIKRACPKGVRVPSWWEGGTLNMCNIVNILKHGGEPTCLRCAANDVQTPDSCADHDSPCPDGCTCLDTEHTHRCDCPVELGVYANGGDVEFPRDHCDPNMCENGATCQNQWDGFFCFCPNGWTGHRCETSVCDWHPCLNGGTCVIDEIGYHCDCPACFGGSCCNVTLTGDDCDGRGTQCPPCTKEENGRCVDDTGYCPGDSQCVATDQGALCQDCDECYTGPLCKVLLDTCKCNNNCPLNSVCEDIIDKNSHECICNDCWRGQNCDEPIVNCDCNNPCDEGQSCRMDGDEAVCGCENDCYTGPTCEELVNTCECNNPCLNEGQCVDSANGPVCECEDCYTGPNCEELVNSCECSNPCPDGETCSQGENGEISCGCSDSCYTGPGCTQLVNSCECANPCNPGQTCSLEDGEFTCSCSQPCKTGDNCETDIISCGCSDPCVHGGTCQETDDGLTCLDCDACWTGDKCDEPVQSCECNNPCPDGQFCDVDENGNVKCGCPDCMTGELCDTPIDSCACNNPCTNADTCQDTENGAICVCDCTGNELCREDRDTGAMECVCPECYYNEPGQAGCLSEITHLCICNNPCTGDQQVCVDSVLGEEPICKIGNPSSGNAFTIVFEENHTEKSLRQVPLELYVTPSTYNSGTRTVNIRSAGLAPDHHCYFNETLTVPENDVLRYEVDRCMRHNKTGLDHVSIRLTEVNNDTMIVYGINKDRWSADGFLATPDVQAGKVFQTVSYSPAHRATQFAIAALFDDTEIEITLSDDNDLPAPDNVAGSVHKLTMNAFETFQVQATCPIERGNKKSSCNKDLSGSIIRASKSIHVFSGNVRAFVKAGEGLSRDHLVEELVPTDRWGSYFGLISVPGRAVGDVLHIMALAGQPTKVDIYFYGDNDEMTSREVQLPVNGKIYTLVDVPSGKRIVVKADNPLSVTQLTKSKDTYLFNNETVHDPVSITVPPVDQFTNNFFFSTPFFTGGENFNLQPYQSTYAMVVAEAGQEEYITLDGAAITDFVMPWGPMPDVNGHENLVGAVFVIPHGTRLIRNTEGNNFQCLIYGFDDRESYGLPAAMNFKKME